MVRNQGVVKSLSWEPPVFKPQLLPSLPCDLGQVACFLSFLFFGGRDLFIYYFREQEREHDWEGRQERERESQAKPDMGFHLTTLGT